MNYARIDNGVVQEVIVADEAFIQKLPGVWLSTEGRKNLPSPGWSYDETRDAFIAPQPEGEVWLIEETCTWETRSERVAKVWEQIKAQREKKQHAGVKVGTKWFHSDTDSRIQQIGLVMMGANVPAVQWKTMDGSFVTMTQTLAGQIFQATAQSDMTIFGVAEVHKAAMEQSPDPLEYDYSTGWPETFA